MANGDQTMKLATALTVAWLENAHTRAAADDVPAFLSAVHKALSDIGGSDANALIAAADSAIQKGERTPAVSVRKSLASPDFIVSMIDGKPYKALRRHLMANGLTPLEYRAHYNLPADYPMTAPNVTKARSEMAKRLGLGRKPGQRVTKVDPAAEGNGSKGRKSKGSSFAEATAAARQHLGGE